MNIRKRFAVQIANHIAIFTFKKVEYKANWFCFKKAGERSNNFGWHICRWWWKVGNCTGRASEVDHKRKCVNAHKTKCLRCRNDRSPAWPVARTRTHTHAHRRVLCSPVGPQFSTHESFSATVTVLKCKQTNSHFGIHCPLVAGDVHKCSYKKRAFEFDSELLQ